MSVVLLPLHIVAEVGVIFIVGAEFTVTEIEFDSVVPQPLLTSQVYAPEEDAV